MKISRKSGEDSSTPLVKAIDGDFLPLPMVKNRKSFSFFFLTHPTAYKKIKTLRIYHFM